MQDTTKRTIIECVFVSVIFLGSIVFLFVTPPEKGRMYDCSLAEISPDYPILVKEQCRKLRAENILHKPK